MAEFFTYNDMVYLIRIFLAIVCGAVIGFERQQRVKVAGLRTHILISLAAALMMIISKYGFNDIVGTIPGLSCDVSRVAAGIITGIGILSGGIIFIGKRGNVSGLTTAAGIWATIGIGMAVGAGMYTVGIGSVIMVELIQFILHHNLPVYRHSVSAIVTFKLSSKEDAYACLLSKLEGYSDNISAMKWEKKSDKERTLRCNVLFDIKHSREDIIKLLNEMPEVVSFEIA